MVLPNFIIAGAPKSATSTLYEYIKQHPDIYMSPVKEPFFFDFNYEKGIQYYESFLRVTTVKKQLAKQQSGT